MDSRLRTLLTRQEEILDLDEGRRDLTGILTRTAGAVHELLSAEVAYAAVAAEASSLVSIVSADGTRTEAWDGPGVLGNRVLQTRQTQTWSADDTDRNPSQLDLMEILGVHGWMGAPIPLPDRPSGLLVAQRDDETPFDGDDREILEVLSRAAARAIANVRSFTEVESLAVTDELTRVYNYRFLKAALRREVERASRYGHVFSIIMIDVDHLKQYNEVHGHLQGSELLRRLAGILSASSRAIDLVAKYGGDEFLVILPQTRTDGGMIMGQRICDAVARTTFPLCKPADITVSIGVSTFPEHGATMEALLAASDEALFRAKRTGRNRVVAADGPGNPARIAEVA